MFASEIGEGNYRIHPGPIRKEAFLSDESRVTVTPAVLGHRLWAREALCLHGRSG